MVHPGASDTDENLYPGTGIMDALETIDSSHRREMRLRNDPPRTVGLRVGPEPQSLQIPLSAMRSGAACIRLDRRGGAVPGWKLEAAASFRVEDALLARSPDFLPIALAVRSAPPRKQPE